MFITPRYHNRKYSVLTATKCQNYLVGPPGIEPSHEVFQTSVRTSYTKAPYCAEKKTNLACLAGIEPARTDLKSVWFPLPKYLNSTQRHKNNLF